MVNPIPLTVIVAKGRWGTVEFVVRLSGGCPARTFFEKDCEEIREGNKHKPESTARARFALLFQDMANYGQISQKRFKKEMGKLFGFSHEVSNKQIRFPCFIDGAKWIVTHGFSKPGAQKGRGAWPDSEVKRAEEIMAEYFLRKRALENNTRKQ
ncbi:MAG: hypothetical protein ACR2FY_08235 [Pirellulaceae bacterium]